MRGVPPPEAIRNGAPHMGEVHRRVPPGDRVRRRLEPFQPERPAEAPELRLGVCGQHHRRVGRLVGSRGRRAGEGRVADPRRRLAGAEEAVDGRRHHGERRRCHRHIDMPAPARRIPLDQRDADRREGGIARRRVGHREADLDGRVALAALGPHRTRHALHDMVVGRPPGPVRVAAVAGERAIDRAGVQLPRRVRPEAEPLHHAGAEVLRHHVCPGDQAQRRIAPLRPLQVERERALAGVDGEEGRAQPVPGAVRLAAHAPQLVATPRRLDLHDIRAQHRQLEGRQRPRDDMREVDDPEAVERQSFRHAGPPASVPHRRDFSPDDRRCPLAALRPPAARRFARDRWAGDRLPTEAARKTLCAMS